MTQSILLPQGLGNITLVDEEDAKIEASLCGGAAPMERLVAMVDVPFCARKGQAGCHRYRR